MKILLNLIFLVMVSCNHSKVDCLDNYYQNIKKEDIYSRTEKALNDTINKWISKRIRLVENLSYYKWKLDGIVFNKDQTKFAGWILKIDPNPKSKFDSAKMFVGEISSDSGITFYFTSIQTIMFSRSENKDKPYEFDNLSEKLRLEICKDNLFNSNTCQINSKYIDSYFEDKENLLQKHKKFLEDTLVK